MQDISFPLFFAFLLMIVPPSQQNRLGGLKYKVDSPEICTLKKDLTEISGLTYDAENDFFYAVNDEKGIIFGIDQKSCDSKVIKNFKKDGDYEGIEKVGKHIYVLKSNGKLSKYNTEKEEITKEYDTPLNIHNDSEGLGYDASTNSLIIACKGEPNTDKKESNKDIHSIYRFDLDTKELVPEPWMLIKDADLLKYYENSLSYFKWLRVQIAKERFDSFAPSAVAINPIDDKVYVLSARGKMLVVLTRDQTVDNIYYLDNSAYIQPEGISFDLKGNMYISNEGKSQKGNIVKILSGRK